MAEHGIRAAIHRSSITARIYFYKPMHAALALPIRAHRAGRSLEAGNGENRY
jgi:hypothetical protein